MLSRRTFLQATAAPAFGGFATHARAAEFNLKLAHNQPTTHPSHIRSAEAVERVQADTGGKVELRIFPSSQLGSDTDTLSQLRSGAVDFFFLSPIILSTLVAKASINGVAFAFPDYDTVWKTMDGPLGAFVSNEVSKANLVTVGRIWDNGFRQITTSNKPIRGPEDLKGFKIRVPVSPLWTSLFKALDAAPVSINFNETYSALQTKIVDGQENPLAILSVAKLYEVQKYCSLTNHMWDGFWLLANKRGWERLPQDVRASITKNFDQLAQTQRADIASLNANLQSEIEAKGVIFNKPDPGPFREALKKAGFYAEWQGKFGDEAWGLLTKSVGTLT